MHAIGVLGGGGHAPLERHVEGPKDGRGGAGDGVELRKAAAQRGLAELALLTVERVAAHGAWVLAGARDADLRGAAADGEIGTAAHAARARREARSLHALLAIAAALRGRATEDGARACWSSVTPHIGPRCIGAAVGRDAAVGAAATDGVDARLPRSALIVRSASGGRAAAVTCRRKEGEREGHGGAEESRHIGIVYEPRAVLLDVARLGRRLSPGA